MERFNLNTWLEDKSRKIVTRDGRPVRIAGTDDFHSSKCLIYGFVGNAKFITSWRSDGTHTNLIDSYDLFFADEEEGLTEFEKVVQNILNEPHYQDIQAVKQFSKTLLDLARKELLKDFPKWKKATEHKEFEVHVCVIDEEMYPYLDTEVNEGEYYIELEDLKTLPKEE